MGWNMSSPSRNFTDLEASGFPMEFFSGSSEIWIGRIPIIAEVLDNA